MKHRWCACNGYALSSCAAESESDRLAVQASLPDVQHSSSSADVRKVLGKRFDDAVLQGLKDDAADRLRGLLTTYEDVFRLEFGHDPPVRVEPLQVRLKEGAVPVKCKQRRNPPVHREFLDNHVREFMDAGLVYENHRSRWASPPRSSQKRTQDNTA